MTTSPNVREKTGCCLSKVSSIYTNSQVLGLSISEAIARKIKKKNDSKIHE